MFYLNEQMNKHLVNKKYNAQGNIGHAVVILFSVFLYTRFDPPCPWLRLSIEY